MQINRTWQSRQSARRIYTCPSMPCKQRRTYVRARQNLHDLKLLTVYMQNTNGKEISASPSELHTHTLSQCVLKTRKAVEAFRQPTQHTRCRYIYGRISGNYFMVCRILKIVSSTVVRTLILVPMDCNAACTQNRKRRKSPRMSMVSVRSKFCVLVFGLREEHELKNATPFWLN